MFLYRSEVLFLYSDWSESFYKRRSDQITVYIYIYILVTIVTAHAHGFYGRLNVPNKHHFFVISKRFVYFFNLFAYLYFYVYFISIILV